MRELAVAIARRWLLLAATVPCLWSAACSKAPAASSGPLPPSSVAAATDVAPGGTPGATSERAREGAPAGATACGTDAKVMTCLRFPTAEDAFRHVVRMTDPVVLAVGEAHAQKGTETIASSTKRFTEKLLPIVAPRASDVVVELWAPDPKCQKEVKQVASAQKPVTETQAATNQNEYLVLGTKSRDLGVVPWLLKPTCDDFSMLADAGADAIGSMLGLIKRLTTTKVTQLLERNRASATADGGGKSMVLAYGGALHNDLAPADEMKDYSFGPELDRLTGGHFVELDLIVPEYIKRTPAWEKLPWYATWTRDGEAKESATLYATGPRSFVLIFPSVASP